MREAPLLSTAAAVGLAAGLCAAQASAQPQAAASMPAPPLPTKPFLQAAAGSDQFEIAAAQTALGQSRDPQVRVFAEQMIRDHEADAQGLQQAATSAGLPPPTMSMSGDQAKLLGALQSLRGKDFDAAYAKQQVLAHTEALVVTRAYATGGADVSVREAAQKALPMIQHRLELAQVLKAATSQS